MEGESSPVEPLSRKQTVTTTTKRTQKTPTHHGMEVCPHQLVGKEIYFFPYFLLKRSTRPAVSTRRWVPVKNGWVNDVMSHLIT